MSPRPKAVCAGVGQAPSKVVFAGTPDRYCDEGHWVSGLHATGLCVCCGRKRSLSKSGTVMMHGAQLVGQEMQ